MRLCSFGYDYQKVGVQPHPIELPPAHHRAPGLFVPGPDERLIKLSNVVIN